MIKIRKFHRWGAWLVSLPLLVIVTTGILLANRDLFIMIQPTTQTGSLNEVGLPLLSVERVIEIARSVPEAEIESWQDIKSIEVKLQKGIYSVRTIKNYEVQIDFRKEVVLATAPRLTGVLVNLHEGTFFKSQLILIVFRVSGLIFFSLYLSGIFLLVYPHFNFFKKKKGF